MDILMKILLYLWQLPQNILGLLLYPFYHKVRTATLSGHRVFICSDFPGGISLGRYIYVRDRNNYPALEQTIMHEIGHGKQSKILGWLYLPIIGVFSGGHNLVRQWKRKKGKPICDYYHFWTERWADKLAGITRLMIMAIIALSFGSCAPRKVLVNNTKVDSVKVVKEVQYIERWRVDTVSIEIPVESKEAIRQDSSYLETKFAKSDAKILPNGTLFHSLHNKPQTIEKEVPIKDTEERTTEKEIIIQKERVEVPIEMPLKRWQKFFIWLGFIWTGAIIAYIVLRIIKRR